METTQANESATPITPAITPELPTPADVFRAIDVYLSHAYIGEPPVTVRSLVATLKTWPGKFFEAVPFARGPSSPPERYSIRLGNRYYPHMKLVLELSPNKQGYLLRADTHDKHVAPPPESPEYPAFRQLMDQNRSISEAIEAAWSAQGLPTFKTYLRDDLARRRAQQA